MRRAVFEIRRIMDEYSLAEEGLVEEMEKGKWEMLRRMMVSGGAVASVNARADSRWEDGLAGVARPYGDKLEAERQQILSEGG
ncbi:hypothetical protein ACFLX5_02425 [Chloroflexota bacterium]